LFLQVSALLFCSCGSQVWMGEVYNFLHSLPKIVALGQAMFCPPPCYFLISLVPFALALGSLPLSRSQAAKDWCVDSLNIGD
jgi:hypothetical protein